MDKFDYSKEAAKLIEFAQRCVENSASDNDTVRRMEIEMKNRWEFRRNLKIQRALSSDRYDLVDCSTLREHVTDYPKLARIYHEVDPDSCKINFTPNALPAKPDATRSKRRNIRNHLGIMQKRNQKRQQLVENAQQNTDLVKTLLGNENYIDLTNSPPPPLPPTALPPTALSPTALPPTALPPTALPPTALPPTALPPTVLQPTFLREQPKLNMFDPSFQYQQLNQTGYNNAGHVMYPPLSPFSILTAPSHTLRTSYYHQQYQVPHYSNADGIPLAHTSSAVPTNPYPESLSLQQQRQRSAQVSPPERTTSKRASKRKVPKSLKKMENIAKKYDLDP